MFSDIVRMYSGASNLVRLKDVPIGTELKIKGAKYYGEDIIFIKIAENHPDYPSNSVTLITKDIITLKPMDAKEPNNPNIDRQRWGNNRYIYSNIRQWLNSDEINWYTPQHDTDEPPTKANVTNGENPYDTEQGFLTYFAPEFKKAIMTTTLEVEKSPLDNGGKETFSNKIFLLSRAEVGLDGTDGTPVDYFSSNDKRICYPTAEAVANSTYRPTWLTPNEELFWWLRSSHSTSSSGDGVHGVLPNGALSDRSASVGNFGIRPALNLPSNYACEVII